MTYETPDATWLAQRIGSRQLDIRRGLAFGTYNKGELIMTDTQQQTEISNALLVSVTADSATQRATLRFDRDVILQEIASAQDSPEDLVFDLAQTNGVMPIVRKTRCCISTSWIRIEPDPSSQPFQIRS